MNKLIFSYNWSNLNILSITVVLYAWFALRSVWLAFNSMNYSPAYYIINQIEGYLCIPFGLIVLMMRRGNKVTAKKVFIIMLPMIYFLLNLFNTYEGWFFGKGVITLIQISIFILFDDSIKKRVFDVFYKMVMFSCVVSLIFWFLYKLNLNIEFETVPFYYGEFAYYKKWIIFAIYHQGSSMSIVSDRLCGIFNEPGALGTICALLFIATYEKSKKWEKVILVATGILTYSFAFFVLIFLFFTLYLNKNNVRNIFAIISLVSVLFLVPQIDFHNDAINKLARRFEITDTGLAGDNRTNAAFDAQFNNYVNSDDVWFGKGAGYSFGGANSSWKSHYLVPFGIFGTVLLLLPWLAVTVHYANGNKMSLLYSVVFFLSLYQRPAPIENILGYVLILGGITWINCKDKEV